MIPKTSLIVAYQGGSETVERRRVAERTARVLPGGEPAHLEMRRPPRLRRRDPQRSGEHEAEAGVVLGAAEQHDLGGAERVGGGEHRMHERHADAAALMLGQHAEGPETEGERLPDPSPAADDVTHDLAAPAAARLGDD